MSAENMDYLKVPFASGADFGYPHPRISPNPDPPAMVGIGVTLILPAPHSQLSRASQRRPW